MRDIEACRTAQLGGHAEHCPTCGFERYAYNSCRNRHCPKCQTFPKVQWVEDRKAELLPVPYFHLVFTVPTTSTSPPRLQEAPLDPPVQRRQSNPRAVWTPQPRRADRVHHGLAHLGSDLRGAFAMSTASSRLARLPSNGERWIEADPRFLFPVRALSTALRGKFCAALAQAGATGACSSRRALHSFAISSTLTSGSSTPRRPFRPCAGLGRVGRYTHRVAIANHRLLDVRDGCVRFAYRSRRQGNRVQTMTLDADEFIRRFLLHVLPRGFMRLRHDGFLANRHKARTLRRCRELLASLPSHPHAVQRVWSSGCKRSLGIDLTQCPHCGARSTPTAPSGPPVSTGQLRNSWVEVPIYDSS